MQSFVVTLRLLQPDAADYLAFYCIGMNISALTVQICCTIVVATILRGEAAMAVYERIQECIDSRGMSMETLAQRCGVPEASLRESLDGNRPISVERYAAICEALEVSLDYFVDLDNR